ncbi:MAG: hypothetical protein STHCBS139747_004135 [Sporothrix thermara]
MTGLFLRRVLAHLLPVAYLVGLANLAVASPEPQLSLDTTASVAMRAVTDEASLLDIEIGVVFPRNETYQQTEILPIAIAVRGFAPLQDSPDFNLIWEMSIYDPTLHNVIYDDLDDGRFTTKYTLPASSTSDSDTTVYVAYTNITSWIGRLNDTDHLVLSVGADWNLTGLCDIRVGGGFALYESVFQIKSDIQLASRPDNTTLSVDTALAQEPDCPEFAMAISAYPTAATLTGYYLNSHTKSYTTTTCSSYITHDTTATDAKACAATVGPDARSAIGSLASSWATSASLSAASVAAASAAAKSTDTSSTNAAAATALPLTPALAAVAAVYCIVYY